MAIKRLVAVWRLIFRPVSPKARTPPIKAINPRGELLINWAVGERLRPRFLRTLSGRLKTAGVAAALVGVTLIAVRVFMPDNFNGSFVSWLPPLVGVPVIVWIVSAYSLCMSAMLSLLDEVAVARA